MNYKQKYKNLYQATSLSDYDISSEIDFVIEMLTGLSSTDILLGKQIEPSFDEKILEVLTERVKTNRPIQQILGKAYFAGQIYSVNENTLIPRPETEFLVDVCKKKFPKHKQISILDIGTGSGCIAIELAKYYINSKITAVDVCQATLDKACENAQYYGVLDKINFVKSDVFSNLTGIFDMIVSNPPYIPFSMEIQKDVYDYEPHSALFADDNGLYFYKKIITEGKSFLNKNSFMAFEVGFNQGNEVMGLFEQNGYVNMLFTQDCDSINRVVSADFR